MWFKYSIFPLPRKFNFVFEFNFDNQSVQHLCIRFIHCGAVIEFHLSKVAMSLRLCINWTMKTRWLRTNSDLLFETCISEWADIGNSIRTWFQIRGIGSKVFLDSLIRICEETFVYNELNQSKIPSHFKTFSVY